MRRSIIPLFALAASACAPHSPLPASQPHDMALATRSTPSARPNTTPGTPGASKLPYDPLKAKDLDLIASKNQGVDGAARDLLARNGFVMLPKHHQRSFAFGYDEAFREHLPVYISADSILWAMHKSFDEVMVRVEEGKLVSELGSLLRTMRARLGSGALAGRPAAVVADADMLLAVGASLLGGTTEAPVAGANAAAIARLVKDATAASGIGDVELFGSARKYDYSQFTPRGHYTRSEALQRYFRATMWLGRTDLRVLDPLAKTPLDRRQLGVAVALRALMDEGALASWDRIDRAARAFVGEPDGMDVRSVDTLLAALGTDAKRGVDAASDEAITSTIKQKGLGRQRIASQLVQGRDDVTRPEPAAFSFLPQRFTIDSEVLSNVSYDRIKAHRMMPSPLDVAYAALGNDGAASLLKGELDAYHYRPELDAARAASESRAKVQAAGLYDGWIGALHALSPQQGATGLPSVATTDAWNARTLNTQLASWAELRHDTILYAKQSYSAMAACEFPAAYVDPYPEFVASVAAYGKTGQALMRELFPHDAEAARHFNRVTDTAGRLEAMAPPTYIAMCHIYADSIEAYNAGFGPHAKEILGDIPNYTDLQPVLQISEVVVG